MTSPRQASSRSISMSSLLLTGVTVALLVSFPGQAEEAFYDRARVIGVTPVERRAGPSPRDWACESYDDPGLARALRQRAGNVRSRSPGIGLAQALRADISLYRARVVGDCRLAGDRSTPVEIYYRVRYEYAGRVYERRMDKDPGGWVRVRVRLGASGGR